MMIFSEKASYKDKELLLGPLKKKLMLLFIKQSYFNKLKELKNW